MQTWDDLVKSVIAARSQQREADGTLYTEIWNYLDRRQHEDIEAMEQVDQPDGRKRGRKLWRGECAFSFRVQSGKVILRSLDDDALPEEPFPGFDEAASRRMAELLCDQRERSYRTPQKPA
jgi:hypothetical protein